jgi:hypothetical protein
MISRKHLNKEGLNQIVAFKGVMNNKLKEELKIAFPDHTTLIRPSYLLFFNKEERLNPYPFCASPSVSKGAIKRE